METKKEFRKYYIEMRSRLGREEAVEKSRLLFERICSLEQYMKAHVVLAYMSFGSEVSTDQFICRCIRDGKTVALPKVVKEDGKGCRLGIYAITDPVADVVPGFRGIREPDTSRTRLLDPGEIDLAVVPGVAFDAAGNRLGYGAGCYDRLLPMLRRDCLKIGAAFEIQLADALPTDGHDFRLDVVVTESRTIICPGTGQERI
jgi:5-formyltetrahydrofolate cyclo-ligase